MHLRARSFTLLVVAACATSCSTAPKPRTPAPTVLVCPAPFPTPPVAGSPNLVVNGGFDTPRITGRRTVSSLAGWLVSGTVKLVASPSCNAVPGSGQYVALGYGASISQAVPTIPGKLYLFQVADSMEGVCNIAYSEIDTYWNSKLVGLQPRRDWPDPRRGRHRLGRIWDLRPDVHGEVGDVGDSHRRHHRGVLVRLRRCQCVGDSQTTDPQTVIQRAEETATPIPPNVVKAAANACVVMVRSTP